jgi:hypothetical protein
MRLSLRGAGGWHLCRQTPMCGPRLGGRVDRYHIWFDLKPGAKDLDLVDAVRAMLGHLQGQGHLEGFVLERRKLGFGPSAIGEWHIAIETRDLAQLDQAFSYVTPRAGEMERLHAAVWSKVTNFQSALYRDFPDPNRVPARPVQGA